MKVNSPKQPGSKKPNSGEVEWISTSEVKKLYRVRDTALKYWRRNKKVRFEIDGNCTYYVKHEIRALVKARESTKRYFGLRKFYEKKFRRIDPFLSMTITCLILGLFYIRPFRNKPFYTPFEVYFPIFCLLGIAFLYFLVIKVMSMRRQYLEKRREK